MLPVRLGLKRRESLQVNDLPLTSSAPCSPTAEEEPYLHLFQDGALAARTGSCSLSLAPHDPWMPLSPPSPLDSPSNSICPDDHLCQQPVLFNGNEAGERLTLTSLASRFSSSRRSLSMLLDVFSDSSSAGELAVDEAAHPILLVVPWFDRGRC